MSDPDDNWMPWDGDPKHPELMEGDDPTQIPGQIDIFGNEVGS
jgi:hypothetical protein